MVSELIEERARTLAEVMHMEQKYGDRPYTYHLKSVVLVLREHGVRDEELIAGAWLHDIVEDTPASIADIEKLFGNRVATIVDLVTDPPGKNRKERKKLAYRRISTSSDAVVVKLADRIANIRESILNENESLTKMYRSEDNSFFEMFTLAGFNDVNPLVKTYNNLINTIDKSL